MWRDRIEAGLELGEELARRGYAARDDVLVLGVPRGGVQVARQVADRLRAPLDIVVVRKVGAPGNPEYAVGAVDLDGRVHPNPDTHVSDAWLLAEGAREAAEAIRREQAYRAGLPPLDVTGRTLIVVDDGIATGLTAMAALRWLRSRKAARTVLAAPVMPPDTAHRLEPEADEVVALETPTGFSAVGESYRTFPQLSDADVVRLLVG